MTYFTVPADKEPTEEQVRAAASLKFSEMQNEFPKWYPESNRESFISDNYEEILHHLRKKVGEPLETYVYDRPLSKFGCLMTIEQFRENVECGGFIDYDGFCSPVKDGKEAEIHIYPSNARLIPLDATHIMWFNR